MVKILVVEDEANILDEVMTWLELEGYEVCGAENGQLALEIIHREHLDLVLCDVNMPELDGHEVLIRLRSDRRYSQLPFIFLTAAADRVAVREGMNMGADDYITKPFTFAEVTTAVKTHLGKHERIQSQIDQLSTLIDSEREQRLLKSRLIGMFSHDFRNPLSAILASSDMLQRYATRMSSSRQQILFQRIDGSIHLLLQMLDEMLMVAEVENQQLSYKPLPTNLKKMIEKITGDFRLIDEEKHTITTAVTLPELVMIDSRFVQHIITNLLSNALKYSPDDSEVNLKASVAENQLMVSVQDAGIGIPESDLAKVFDPFFRAGNVATVKGTGLGLALIKQLVDISAGKIAVTSEMNVGSVFALKIPLPDIAV